ncbi:cell division cycle protein 20 homolog [Patiria miniata]|uniref:Cell division cycle protein 20 homolog n=1 Tax=Patiria miniata TaxID=46514 RepID=A0A914BF09_PATMI|nr:cell division cycle protein 20 homolog [Patiria miniata]XP_038074665.1 cell division cycle protein 20 homolog [Patiria miniata]
MTHLNFESDVNSLLRLDGPMGGPAMRWQRKATETSMCNASLNRSLNKSLNRSLSKSLGNVSGISPMKTSNHSFSKTPSKSRTPSGKKSKTPGKTPSKLPVGDRFIPNRSGTNFDISAFKLLNSSVSNQENQETQSPQKLDYCKTMSDNLNGDLLNAKILSYKNRPPVAPEGFQNNLRVLYSHTKTPGSTKKSVRHIPQVPERILDAPDILDDYYLNLIDWSLHNHLAVALGNNVYLWDASSGSINHLMQLEGEEDYVCSVSWVQEGNFLGVGTSNGDVQLWDVAATKRLRNMSGHAARVGSLAWNNFILSSGSRSGAIHHHDVRVQNHQVATLAGHTQEVCGLKWSPEGRYLASGGNDNLLNIWPSAAQGDPTTPVHTFTQHQAAVKALAWCPWQPSVLVSGGGTADRYLRFWNVNTGTCLNSVDTKSQVCSVLWSKEHRELVSAHGFAQNQLIIWKYPTMNRISELLGHTSRILHMCMSPDGTTVATAAGDETLRLWKCFQVDQQQKTAKKGSTQKASSGTLKLRQSIR